MSIKRESYYIGIYTLCVLPSVFTCSVCTQLEIGIQRPFKEIEEEVVGIFVSSALCLSIVLIYFSKLKLQILIISCSVSI